MKKNIALEKHKLISIVFAFFFYFLWLAIYKTYENRNIVSDNEIVFLSWFGIIVCICAILIWKKLTGKYFTLFNIFLAFFSVFNFGQCFLWAVGVHSSKEIGKKLLFGVVSCDNLLIAKAQLLFIICFIMINAAALFIWSKRNKRDIIILNNYQNTEKFDCLYITSIILSILVIPLTLYKTFNTFIMGQLYSYHDLYYGDISSTINNSLINILRSLFLPCLFGLLIGSKYKKSVRIFVYCIYAIFSLISLLTGDRGEWINGLIILFWADTVFFKKRNPRKMFLWMIIAFLSLYLMNAIVSLRNIGLSWKGFTQALFAIDSNPIVSLLIEFGNSMSISIILIKNNVVCPYGNTYFMSLLTMFSTALGNQIFGLDYTQLHTWFPMEYLQIRSGTDFSMIGEAILNFGVYLAPVVIFIMGLVIAKIANFPYEKKESPLKLCLFLSAFSFIVKIARSTVWLVLNSICWSVVIFIVAYYFIQMTFFKNIKGKS